MSDHNVPDSKLTVIDYAYNKNGKAYWNCICDCGNKTIAASDNIRSGNTKSCGCIFKKTLLTTNHNKRLELSGKKFGLLTALYPIGNQGSHIIWHCRCDCGNETNVRATRLKMGEILSCGCLAESRGEKIIENILIQNNYKYVYNKEYFKDLIRITGKKLRYDFIILDNNENVIRLCEYDGEQHFHPVEIFGGQENFEQQQERDSMKNEYAWSHNIPIVRIPYTEKNITLETIMSDQYLVRPPQESENGN